MEAVGVGCPEEVLNVLEALRLAAKRWVFILSGVTHPRFEELFLAVTTPAQREKVSRALGPIVAGQEVAAAA